MRFRTDVQVGCCGFAYVPETYFKVFRAVEIQQTFNRLPRPETVAKWREQAPPGTVFSLKAWQVITHDASSPGFRFLDQGYMPQALDRCGGFRTTDEVMDAWQALRGVAGVLHAGAILFQSPPGFDPSAEHILRMEEFFRTIDRGRLMLAWAPPEGWPHKIIEDVCRRSRLVHCADPFTGPVLSRGPIYYRLHGIGGYRHRYSDDELLQLRRYCRRKRGLVFFNNLHMQEDARRFAALLAGNK